jgi:hypothetical protein
MRHLSGLYGRAGTSTFELGPSGNTTGQRRLTGECRLSSLEYTFPLEDQITFAVELTVDGAVTENVW